MKIGQYDIVSLKDGREAVIVEKFDDATFLADVGNGPEDWETISVTIFLADVGNGPEDWETISVTIDEIEKAK